MKYYKTPAGSPPNEFAFDEQVKGKEFTVQVVNETHDQWKKLITGEIPAETDDYSISLQCTVYDCPSRVSQEEATSAATEAFKAFLHAQ